MVAVGGVGRDQRDDGDAAGVGEQSRDVRDAPDVLVAGGGVEAEVAAEPVADVVAVEDVGEAALLDEAALQRGCDRRLARRREAREPDCGAVLADRGPACVAVQLAVLPGDVGAVGVVGGVVVQGGVGGEGLVGVRTLECRAWDGRPL
jgi:hypothetical protein